MAPSPLSTARRAPARRRGTSTCSLPRPRLVWLRPNRTARRGGGSLGKPDHDAKVTIKDRRKPLDFALERGPRRLARLFEPGDAHMVAVQLPRAFHAPTGHDDGRDP